MYVETQVLNGAPKVETATRAPVLADAMPTLGGHVSAPPAQNARFFMNVTAASGTTPSMTMNIYGVVNGQMYFLASFSAATVAGQFSVQVNNCPDKVCFAPTITGTTPSFTVSEIFCVR